MSNSPEISGQAFVLGDRTALGELETDSQGHWYLQKKKETTKGGSRYVLKVEYTGEAKSAKIFADEIFVLQRAFTIQEGTGKKTLTFGIRPDLLKRIPPDAALSIVVGNRLLLNESGSDHALLPGTGKPGMLIESFERGYYLTKKGTFILPISRNPSAQQAVLLAVKQLDADLREGFGYSLWLAHGTLLGLVREGGFLELDDDFDTAYLSNAESVDAVCEERAEIAQFLMRRGWSVRLTSPSGLLRLKVKGASIDIMPGWRQNDYFFCLGYTMIDMTEDQILPVAKAVLAGHEVNVPRETERFLAQKYGPSWRYPDPSYVARRPDGAKDILSRGFLTSRQAMVLNEALLKDISSSKDSV